MGTPDFAVPCLDILVDSGYEVTAVITQPDRPKGRGQKLAPSPVKAQALKHGLKVIQPEKIKNPDFICELTTLKPDIIIVVAFGQFLPKSLLDLPTLGCINVHASLLPSYRGAAPIHWAVINGEKATGVTTMYMDVGMDTGDMIQTSEIPIRANDTTGEIHDKLSTLGAQVLKESVELIVKGCAPRIPQPQALATYAPLLTRELEMIDWSRSAEQIHNLVRGLNPWPGAYCQHNGKSLKVWETKVYNNHVNGQPSLVHEITESSIMVETGKGIIELLTVQPASKRRMNAHDYACGYGITIGDFLK
jgi:methionyl-tRNA formyltransferase